MRIDSVAKSKDSFSRVLKKNKNGDSFRKKNRSSFFYRLLL